LRCIGGHTRPVITRSEATRDLEADRGWINVRVDPRTTVRPREVLGAPKQLSAVPTPLDILTNGDATKHGVAVDIQYTTLFQPDASVQPAADVAYFRPPVHVEARSRNQETLMHPKKAEMLSRLEDASRVHDAALERSFNVVKNPGEFGWEKSILTAAVVVPLTGVSAIITDLSHALLSRSDDSAWDHGGPPPAKTDEKPGDAA
jgi:hypothetical protein